MEDELAWIEDEKNRMEGDINRKDEEKVLMEEARA